MPKKSPSEYKEIIALAYTDYEMLGPSRSLAKLARQGQAEGKPWSNLATVEAWSSKYGWVKRAAQYDKEQQEAKRIKKLHIQEEMDSEQSEVARGLWIKTAKLLNDRLDKGDIHPRDAVALLKINFDIHRLAAGAITAKTATELSSNPEKPLTIVAQFGISDNTTASTDNNEDEDTL